MKQLFLASGITYTAQAIAEDIGDPAEKRLAFITTASELEEDLSWQNADRKALLDAGFDLFDYTITGKTLDEITTDLADIDLLHVNGGNTFYLLQKIQETKFDLWVSNAISNGTIYIGSSAGTQIAGQTIEHVRLLDDPDKEFDLPSYEAMQLVDLTFNVHWGGKYSPEIRKRIICDSYDDNNAKSVVLRDNQYIKVIDDMYKIVDITD